jgi:hypothetical protein
MIPLLTCSPTLNILFFVNNQEEIKALVASSKIVGKNLFHLKLQGL